MNKFAGVQRLLDEQQKLLKDFDASKYESLTLAKQELIRLTHTWTVEMTDEFVRHVLCDPSELTHEEKEWIKLNIVDLPLDMYKYHVFCLIKSQAPLSTFRFLMESSIHIHDDSTPCHELLTMEHLVIIKHTGMDELFTDDFECIYIEYNDCPIHDHIPKPKFDHIRPRIRNSICFKRFHKDPNWSDYFKHHYPWITPEELELILKFWIMIYMDVGWIIDDPEDAARVFVLLKCIDEKLLKIKNV